MSNVQNLSDTYPNISDFRKNLIEEMVSNASNTIREKLYQEYSYENTGGLRTVTVIADISVRFSDK